MCIMYNLKSFSNPYLIAELGSNHNGDMKLAKKLVLKAMAAGAHCVKFQSWTKESIFSKQVYESNYFLNDDYRDRTDFSLEKIVEKYSISENELGQMHSFCKEIGIVFASTPFSMKEVDFLVDDLKVEFIKIASMDCNNYPFLEYIGKKGLPIILSTGLSTLSEIDKAVSTIESTGNYQIAILHCVANYPPKDEHVNLRNIDMLIHNYPNYPIGFSDHSIGTAIPLAAIARGACIIEKHFTLDKNMAGWDHKVSATESELKFIASEGKRIVVALGNYRRSLSKEDLVKITAFRRSIVAAKEIPIGKIIERNDLDLKRPGTGIAPEILPLLIGKVAKKSVEADTLISLDDF
jgi:sialic acid synthase SpsE